jgi:hypothetical protein
MPIPSYPTIIHSQGMNKITKNRIQRICQPDQDLNRKALK